MRTYEMIINHTKNKKYAALCQYFQANTADSKRMYNTANFYIRNTMTGLKKSPEKRTHSEIEVLHYVFTSIQQHNDTKIKELKALKLRNVGGLHCERIMRDVLFKKLIPYPTKEKWFLSYETLETIFKLTENPVYRRMNSHVNQNAIRKVIAAWTGYFKSLKQYDKTPSAFTGKPHIPGYKKEAAYTAWFSNQVAKFKEEGGKYYISFVNMKEKLCIGNTAIYEGLKYMKTEIKPIYGQYRILITFDDKIKEIEAPEHPSRILGLDPGVGNFLGVANNFGGVPFVIRGGALKSENRYFNKKRAKLMSKLTKGSDSQHSAKYSRQLNAISRRRESFLKDYFYKCAWYVCRYALSAGVEVIVMGHNKGQKQEISLNSVNNQNFVSIPYYKFIQVLKCVAAKCGIAVVIREESYTSQANLLDMDSIPTYKEGQNIEYTFSGKRVHRGLYQSATGILMNADINGAGNIIRKEYPDAFQNIKDFSYLHATTLSIGYKDLYRNAKSVSARPKKYKYHKSGKYTVIRNSARSAVRSEYRKLWGTCGLVCLQNKDEQNKTENNKAA